MNTSQKDNVLRQIKEGKGGFAGTIAVDSGFISKENFDQALHLQALEKVKAAIADFETIKNCGPQSHEPWLKANWGNNGVNPVSKESSTIDGASSLANFAQNIVILANNAPELTRIQSVKTGITGAEELMLMITGKKQNFSLKDATLLIDQVGEGVRASVKESRVTPKDIKNSEINTEDFISFRSKEIMEAVKQRLVLIETSKVLTKTHDEKTSTMHVDKTHSFQKGNSFGR